MIRERQIFESIMLHYKDAPTSVSVTLDGTTVATISDLPSHFNYKSRRVSVPSGFSGYVPQIQIDTLEKSDFQFSLTPAKNFSTQQIWHYFELTVSGDTTISLYLDEVKLVDKQKIVMPTLPDSEVKKYSEYTVKVFYPPLSFGYVPHVYNETSDEGDIILAKPVALPSRFYANVNTHSECRITYKGRVEVQFYIDGKEIGDPYHFEPKYNLKGFEKYVTEKFYLPSGSHGHIFQWETTGLYGSEYHGDIAVLETDSSLGATDIQPQVPGHGVQQ